MARTHMSKRIQYGETSFSKEHFLDPPVEYRSVPFWSWNDRITKEEALAQLRDFYDKGVGGVFIHARPGLWTPFLSDTWFSLFTECLEFGRKTGMKIWIYDESSYPSGFAGGLVHDRAPHLAQKVLACHLVPEGQEVSELRALASFWLFGHPEGGLDYAPASKGEAAPRAGARLVHFAVHTHPGLSWYNGAPYVDVLHPEAAQAFLQVAYEPYRQRFAEDFGSIIPGVFTDEPHFHRFQVDGAWDTLPWTPDLPREFQRRYGWDLLKRLPELVFDTVHGYGLRVRYWELLSRLFVERWLKPIYEWCDAHGLLTTGHFWEHTFNPECTGSLMLPAAWQHIPGIDVLGRDSIIHRQRWDLGEDGTGNRIPRQMGNIAMVKAVTSVANQTGRQRVLSETYGGAGWEISFAEQKVYAEWQAVLGVNLLNQHLSHYSLRGERKHDHPPSFQAHQPWWDRYPVLHEYIARLYYALSVGRYEANVAVLHPMTSLWIGHRRAPDPFGTTDNPHPVPPNLNDRLMVAFDSLLKTLSAAGWTYDLVDELLLQDIGHADVKGLRVGDMHYSVLVIPPALNLRSETVAMLTDWIEQGGVVAAVAPTPQLVDGVVDERIVSFLAHCRLFASDEELVAWLPAAAQRRVSLTTPTGPADIYTHVRKLDDGWLIFACNVSPKVQTDVTVRVAVSELAAAGEHVFERWDLRDGSVTPMTAESCRDEYMGDVLQACVDFAVGESHLFVVRARGSSAKRAASEPDCSHGRQHRHGVVVTGTAKTGRHEPRKVGHTLTLNPNWRFRRLDPNVLVLGRVAYRIGGGDGEAAWRGPVPVGEMKREVRRYFGLPELVFREMQPWRKYPGGVVEPVHEPVCLRYTFELGFMPDGDIQLVVEEGKDWHIVVNGIPVVASGDHWLDPAFHCIPIRSAVRPGTNVIEMQRPFHADVSLEPAFLIGDFAVRTIDLAHFTLAPESSSVQAGSWIFQGYPFYAGRAIYSQDVNLPALDGQRVWVELSNMASTYAWLRVNGADVGALAWEPYRAEITHHIKTGLNTIEIEVANSLRNVLGPHHRLKPRLVTPGHWKHDAFSTTEYVLVPDGFPNEIRLVFA